MEVKEAPARGLRAVFAGFGRALGVGRKGGAAPAAKAEATSEGHVKVVDTEAAAPAATAPDTAATETVAAETTTTSEATPAETTMPDVVVAEPAVAEPVAAAPVAAEAAAGDELPLANYDTLTVASLRARLRTLTIAQLRILVDYEKAHQGREEVTGMFERRIAKIVAGETTGFPAVK